MERARIFVAVLVGIAAGVAALKMRTGCEDYPAKKIADVIVIAGCQK